MRGGRNYNLQNSGSARRVGRGGGAIITYEVADPLAGSGKGEAPATKTATVETAALAAFCVTSAVRKKVRFKTNSQLKENGPRMNSLL